jgi:hypothetical protein
MNQAIMQEITLLRDFLDQQNELGILIGAHQNVDTVSAALSLFLSLTQAGKKVQIISKKAPTVEVSNLVGIDKVKENFTGNTNKLVVSLPYIKGEVEKVLFTEAQNTINFHLTAAPDRSISPFDISDVKLLWDGGAPQAIITVGVGSIDELVGITDPNSAKIVNIDNYQANTRFGDVVLVDESFSSLSEIVGKIIKDLQLPMDIDISQNILDGVLFATRNFTKQNTSPLAFEAASAAMYQGAQRKNEDTGRRDQAFSGQNRQNQGQDRGGRDNRGQSRQPRISENDFPAMHMQGQSQQNTDNRRMNNPTRQQPQMPPQRQQSRFNQQQSRQQGSQNQQQQYPQETSVQDGQIIEDAQISQPVEDMSIPQNPSYPPQSNEDVPDDWLMPKVFKGSKNNN